jgi:hypothetical protein
LVSGGHSRAKRKEQTMTHYLLSVHTADAAPNEQMTDEQMQQGYAQVDVLESEMRAAGALVFSGRLEDPESARVVGVADGETTTTDGPFIESKESIGGFYIIQADDLAAALAWAAKTSAAIDKPIEVRPFSGAQAT